ncbi:PREDICTED: uncharacterized protein LOC106107349 isoform X1 [Papilio polytes]|uniref:uncharacterized protein LOC106107349 isoform X1 n=1 Tax=Papilio polytes TaxID=76194 RepID=UPI000675D4F0|nr:PREDICTED: uncharacterized protein LOC106107349 isoform X1 [Papilio polytes]
MNEENRKNIERKRKCDDLLGIDNGKIIKTEIEDTSGTESNQSVPLFASSIKKELNAQIKSEPAEENVEDSNEVPNDSPEAIKDECNLKLELFEESETSIQFLNNTTKQPQASNSKTKKQLETQPIVDGPRITKQFPEKYESKDGTICVNTNTIDEKVLEITKVDNLTIEFDPLENNIDTSSLNYNYDTESRDFLVESTDNEEPAEVKRRRSSVAVTPEIKNLTEIKKNSVRNLSTCIIKRKKDKQINEDALTNKKLEILEIQYQQEVMKLEKTRILLDLDIELKRVILENAKLDLELKKNS